MGERYNGNIPSQRGKGHGSTRRGLRVVPSRNYLENLQKAQLGKQDYKERLLSAIREKSPSVVDGTSPEPTVDTSQDASELGNKNLPIFRYKQHLLRTIEDNKAIILMGPTGSGKSTQLPQYMIEAGFDHVFVIQGRRIMADGLGERVQAELEESLGSAADNLVGIIHGGRVERHVDNKITALTANSFIRMANDITKEHAGKKIGVVVDEVHEDDPHVEVAMGLAGIMVRDEDNFRLAAVSATINPDSIKQSLGRITNQAHPETIDVPVFKVEGRPFNVEIISVPDMTPDQAYLAHGRDHRIAILSTKGKNQIDAIRNKVRDGLTAAMLGRTEFRELSGGTSPLQRLAIERLARTLPEEKRLVVIASPAGKSGITIPGATFAATDAMINREIRDDDGYWGLETEYVSQAEIIQILGRVGRDASGAVGYICRPMPGETRNMKRIEEFKSLYPFKAMSDRPEYPEPAIFNTNMSGMVLEVAAIGRDYEDINQFTLNELDAQTIRNTKNRLIQTYGALDYDGKITEIGRLMDRFPVSVEFSRGIAEGMLQGRSHQQLARLALIASAVDVGGVQQFRGNTDMAWKRLLSSGASDDFIAQLDIMSAIVNAEPAHETVQDRYRFLWENDLNTKSVDDALKIYRKALRRLNLHNHPFEVETPSYREIEELRYDFTAGMFDTLYRDAGMQGKERVYTHVRDKESERFRIINPRSVTEPEAGLLISGIPQYYREIRNGALETKNILSMTLRVDPKAIGHFALQNGLVRYEPIKNSSRINGGMVLERENIMFGTLQVGSHDVVKSREIIPEESQRALVQYVLQNPGPSQETLRLVADELSEYRRILPMSILDTYRNPEAPSDFTKSDIEKLLRQYAARTRNAQEIDLLLGEHSSQKNIAIDRYYDDRARAEIISRSPATIFIGGSEVTVHYDKGEPYVTRLTKQQELAVSGPIYLDDNRQVLRQIKKESGRGTRRVPFGPVS